MHHQPGQVKYGRLCCCKDYLALRQTQGSIRTDAPNWQPWLVFFLRSLAEQVRRLEKKVEREKIVLATLPELSLQIVEFAREHGRDHDRRCDQIDGCQPKHAEATFPKLGRARSFESAGNWAWCLVRTQVMGLMDV